MSALIALVAVAGTVLAGFAAAWLLPLPRLVDRVVAGAVCCSALVVGGSLLLSVPGAWFTRPGVLTLALLEVAIAAALWARAPAARALARADLRRAGAGLVALPRAVLAHPLVTVLCAAAVVLVVWRTIAGLVIGVRDFDGLWFHLVTTLAFVHEHRVGVRIPLNIYADAYAPNIEIHAAWLTVVSGSATYAAVTQVPFALLGAAVTTAIGRRFGLAVAPAVGAGALFVLTPVVIDQLSRAYTDVAVAALLLAGLHFAAIAVADRTLAPRQTVVSVAMAGVALGVATGAKASAWPATVLIGLVLLVTLTWRTRRRLLSARTAVTAMGVGVAAVALLGVPYYVRDILVFGNPLQPFTLTLGPVTLDGPLKLGRDLVAPFRPSWDAGLPSPLVVAAVWAGLRPTEHGIEIRDYLGSQWFALWPCLAAVTLWAMVRWRRHGHFLMVAGVCLVAVAGQPVGWWGRYVIYVVAPAAVAFFAVASAMGRSGRLWTVVGWLGTAGLVAVVLSPLQMRFTSAPSGVPDTPFGRGGARPAPAGEILDALRGGRSLTVWDGPQFRWAADAPAGSRIMVTARGPYLLAPIYGPTAANAPVLVAEPARPDSLGSLMRARGLTYAYLLAVDPVARYALAHPSVFRRVGAGGGSVTVRLVAGAG